MSDVAKLKEILDGIKVYSAADAQKVVSALCGFVNEVESKIAEIAVEHEVRAYIDGPYGPYGASRWVNLEGDSYYNIEPGEWQASAQSC